MRKIHNKIIIIIFFLITACAESWDDVKKGLGGQKRTSTDEFLVKKKDPLVMPPKWRDLPRPGQNIQLEDDVEDLQAQNAQQQALIDSLKFPRFLRPKLL